MTIHIILKLLQRVSPSGLYMDIEKYINEKTLIDSFVLDTLGLHQIMENHILMVSPQNIIIIANTKVKIWFC